MPDKINVIKTVDEEGHDQYTVFTSSLTDLANVLGVTEDRFAVEEDEKLIRQRRMQELNRRMNTPEAIRQRDIDPVHRRTGELKIMNATGSCAWN
jgi:hypothetical protein